MYFVGTLKYLMKEDWLMSQVLDSKWDLVVVDEAHQLRWAPDNSSPEYDFLSAIRLKYIDFFIFIFINKLIFKDCSIQVDQFGGFI